MSTTTQENLPKSEDEIAAQRDANRDPLSGRAGAHPVGTGVGAATGGIAAGVAAGAAIGTVAGPIGTAVGAAAGAVVGAVGGGLAGKAIAEHVNPTEEHGYWRANYAVRPYVVAGRTYEEYAPAYQYGWESWARHTGRSFDDVEIMMQRDWEKVKGTSSLGWHEVKEAARDSWNRVSKRRSGK